MMSSEIWWKKIGIDYDLMIYLNYLAKHIQPIKMYYRDAAREALLTNKSSSFKLDFRDVRKGLVMNTFFDVAFFHNVNSFIFPPFIFIKCFLMVRRTVDPEPIHGILGESQENSQSEARLLQTPKTHLHLFTALGNLHLEACLKGGRKKCISAQVRNLLSQPGRFYFLCGLFACLFNAQKLISMKLGRRV